MTAADTPDPRPDPLGNPWKAAAKAARRPVSPPSELTAAIHAWLTEWDGCYHSGTGYATCEDPATGVPIHALPAILDAARAAPQADDSVIASPAAPAGLDGFAEASGTWGFVSPETGDVIFVKPGTVFLRAASQPSEDGPPARCGFVYRSGNRCGVPAEGHNLGPNHGPQHDFVPSEDGPADEGAGG